MLKLSKTFYKFNSFHNIGVRLCLIADTHDCVSEGVIQSIKSESPDVIAISGDFLKMPLHKIDKYFDRESNNRDTRHISGAENAIKLLKFCAGYCPTFVSLGNHESHFDSLDKKYCEELKVTVLDNSFVTYNKLCIGGLSSGYKSLILNEMAGKIVLSRGENSIPVSEKLVDITWLDDFKRHEGYKVLLCHHPEYYNRLFDGNGIDLILSGHAHGGTIRIFGFGLYAHGQGILPKYTSGVVDEKMVVSRGIATNSLYIPRIFNKPEVVYIDI